MMLPSEVEPFKRERAEMQRVIDARQREEWTDQRDERRALIMSIIAFALFVVTVVLYAFWPSLLPPLSAA